MSETNWETVRGPRMMAYQLISISIKCSCLWMERLMLQQLFWRRINHRHPPLPVMDGWMDGWEDRQGKK